MFGETVFFVNQAPESAHREQRLGRYTSPPNDDLIIGP